MTIILIWLAGVIISYFLGRYLLRRDSINWTNIDRAALLTLCVSSFLGLLLAGVSYLFTITLKEKEVEW